MICIKYCTKCGNRLVENAKYCTHCGSKVLFTVKAKFQGVEQDYEHNKTEEEIAKTIIDDLGVDKTLFEYAKPCEDYSTIRYKGYDLFRLKYTENTKWIRIPMTTQMRKDNIDNKLFDAEKNKNKVLWKSELSNPFVYKDLLLEFIAFRDEELQKKG